jgi:NAD(P)H-dependent nitrite reductase small subunit
MAFLNTELASDALPANGSYCVKIGAAQVGLFRTAAGLFAIDNVCPHRGAPLHDGFVTDGQVTCPWHQWQFGLADGKCRNIPGPKIAAYPVEIRDGTIWIDLG